MPSCEVCRKPSETQADYNGKVIVVCSRACQRRIGADGSLPEKSADDYKQDLLLASRKLWHEHVAWTREVIVKSIDWFREGSPDTSANLDAQTVAVQRLLRNQQEIGALVGGFLGNADVGSSLADLLQEHIRGAAAILFGARDDSKSLAVAVAALGDDPRKAPALPANFNVADSPLIDAVVAWYENGREIVELLDSLETAQEDKVLPAAIVQPEFNAHLWQTIVEAVRYLQGDYAGSAAVADEATEHILSLSDVIVAQLTVLVESDDGDGGGKGNLIEAVEDALEDAAEARRTAL